MSHQHSSSADRQLLIAVCSKVGVYVGPGEQGAAVHVSDSERGREAYAANGFNIQVSDRISLNRSLSDIRHKK